MRWWSVFTGIVLILALAAPALAADPQAKIDDLKGISPKRHRYIFSVLGGAAVGAGIGVLVGGGADVVKGLMVGGGGASAAYLHANRNENLNGWRDWALIGSYTSTASGVGWTLCGCDDGAIAGALIGGGAGAIWRASQRRPRTQTASTTP
jgi:hypothetical protein